MHVNKYLAVIMSLVLVSSCSDDDVAAVQSNLDPVERDVTVNFAAQVNGANFTCGQTYTGVGTGSHDYKINDFRLYVHDAYIHDSISGDFDIELTQDAVWQLDNVALLDFENSNDSTDCNGTPETNTQLVGKLTLPPTVATDATQMCFTVGVPVEKNHLDTSTAASPLNATGMFWAWKVGYKYIRVDGAGDPTGVNEAFNLHLGAQGCPAGTATAPPTTACTAQNIIKVCIDNFDLDNSVVAVDLGPVFEANDVSTNLVTNATAKPGCQSFIDDDDCEEIMPRLGLDYSYGHRAGATVSTYNGGQKMFSKQ